MKDRCIISAEVHLLLFDERTGVIKDERRGSNMIPYTGYDLIRQCIGKTTGRPTGGRYIAIGGYSGAVAKTDSGLGNELARSEATYGESETVAGYKDRWTEQVTFGAGEGTWSSVTETGIFNNSLGGSGLMLSRQTFTGVNKSASDSLVVTWTYTIGQP